MGVVETCRKLTRMKTIRFETLSIVIHLVEFYLCHGCQLMSFEGEKHHFFNEY